MSVNFVWTMWEPAQIFSWNLWGKVLMYKTLPLPYIHVTHLWKTATYIHEHFKRKNLIWTGNWTLDLKLSRLVEKPFRYPDASVGMALEVLLIDKSSGENSIKSLPQQSTDGTNIAKLKRWVLKKVLKREVLAVPVLESGCCSGLWASLES